MQVELWKDADAWARLESAWLREQWERLYDECPWGSVFQSVGYVATWYDVYRSRYSPLIVAALGSGGGLVGLLTLARSRDGQIVAAGARQAEYQVWLARQGDGDAFIEAALARLGDECRGRTLTLRYMPPETPRRWLTSGRGVAGRCELRGVPRPIMDVGPWGGEERPMGKESRRRLRRLESLGPVTYERLTDPAAIDSLLDEIAPLCDLRHAAIHGIAPFRDDPLKAPFHRALARVPGALYVSVLRCGGRVACAGVDADNRGQVSLGVAAFSPFVARFSPTRFHLPALARDLATRGYQSIDLTPGDDPFKGEWATRFDEAYTLRVFFGARQLAAWRAARAVRKAARTVVVRAGANPAALVKRLDRLREAVDAARTSGDPTGALRALGRGLWANREVHLYEFDQSAVARLPTGTHMRVDQIGDLLAYRPGVTGVLPRRVFLRHAISRLERSGHVYTLMRGSELVAMAWVSAPPAAPVDAGLEAAMRPDAALVHDLVVPEPLRGSAEWSAVLPEVVREAARLPDVAQVRLAVPSDRDDLAEAARRLGGAHVGTLYERARAGRTRRWSTLPRGAPAGLQAEPGPAEVGA